MDIQTYGRVSKFYENRHEYPGTKWPKTKLVYEFWSFRFNIVNVNLLTLDLVAI